jgi:hemoglobin
MIEDLFDLIGGRTNINAATEVFYDRVLQDDNLRPFFEGVDMAHLRSRQTMFISMLLGGRVYTGALKRQAPSTPYSLLLSEINPSS